MPAFKIKALGSKENAEAFRLATNALADDIAAFNQRNIDKEFTHFGTTIRLKGVLGVNLKSLVISAEHTDKFLIIPEFNFGVTAVPSMCGMYIISCFNAVVNTPPVLVSLGQQLAVVRNAFYRLLYEARGSSPTVEMARTRCPEFAEVDDLYKRWNVLSQGCLSQEYSASACKEIADKLYEYLASNAGYKRSQYILTDNLIHNGQYFRVSRIVPHLPGMVIAGPLTNNENHHQQGRVQTYLWIPEGGSMDTTFGDLGGAMVIRNKTGKKVKAFSTSEVSYSRDTLTKMFSTDSNTVEFLQSEDN